MAQTELYFRLNNIWFGSRCQGMHVCLYSYTSRFKYSRTCDCLVTCNKVYIDFLGPGVIFSEFSIFWSYKLSVYIHVSITFPYYYYTHTHVIYKNFYQNKKNYDITFHGSLWWDDSAVDFEGPEFPALLVGKRLLVAAECHRYIPDTFHPPWEVQTTVWKHLFVRIQLLSSMDRILCQDSHFAINQCDDFLVILTLLNQSISGTTLATTLTLLLINGQTLFQQQSTGWHYQMSYIWLQSIVFELQLINFSHQLMNQLFLW